jgi:hypothetical protein
MSLTDLLLEIRASSYNEYGHSSNISEWIWSVVWNKGIIKPTISFAYVDVKVMAKLMRFYGDESW